MPDFKLVADYEPMGDQPTAIQTLIDGIHKGNKHQILLGATGTGKTFTVAKVIEHFNRPTLVMAHNKTLAAQLYAEFKDFFPHNAVEYFVSYYDYYQPEAYVPQKDLYIEKETDINEDIDRLRLAATASLLSRRDVIIVASVSCIYGIGSPYAWGRVIFELHVGQEMRRDVMLRHFVAIQYTRNDMVLQRGTFRVRGDTMEIQPAYAETAYRIRMFGDEIEALIEFDPLTGELLAEHDSITIFPAKHFITETDTLKEAIHDIEIELDAQLKVFKDQSKVLEAQRLEQRVRYDVEMLREVGFTSGIENYSRHLDRRAAGSPPWTLIDYFPKDYLIVLDESHITVPQIRGMYGGDRSRKTTLVEYGFRLPSALDNRPLNFEEFEERMGATIYMSATPGPYEEQQAEQVAQQVIRPTGILDPEVEIRPVEGQIDDLLAEIQKRVNNRQRVLVTTLTQKMAEDLSQYLIEMGIRATYLHAEIDTIERVEILRDLRLGVYDVLVGINLLREGLDLPEVSLVAILDADKEGFLRSTRSLIQTLGRAARHVDGRVIMYANKITDSMKEAIDETNRRRQIQMAYNQKHGIEPRSIVKEIRDLTNRVRLMQAEKEEEKAADALADPALLSKDQLRQMISDLEFQMKQAAKNLEFEKAAAFRDQVVELRQIMALKEDVLVDPAMAVVKQVTRK
ncbi:MAG: excinuclease ABC subunit UvrB [Anaerolineae bacterium]|nr:MAG: excinuclease ABC subunit UvrB [Anaerolineae bacterium]